MPLVEVSLAAGRTKNEIRLLMHLLHQAVIDAGIASADRVRVIVHEIPLSHWAAGDVTLEEQATGGAAQANREEA